MHRLSAGIIIIIHKRQEKQAQEQKCGICTLIQVSMPEPTEVYASTTKSSPNHAYKIKV